jgi:hypothetical protein
MKVKILTGVLLFGCCLAFAMPAESQSRVLVRDERGRLLMSTRSIPLSGGRAAISVAAYERIGLHVKRQVKAKRVAIGIPDSDSGVLLYAGSYIVRDFMHEKPQPPRNDTPVAVLRGGQFYASAAVVKKAFSDSFTTTWDKRTHTIVLQRRKQFARYLELVR